MSKTTSKKNLTNLNSIVALYLKVDRLYLPKTSKPLTALVLFVNIFSNLPVNHFSPPRHLPVRPFVGGPVKEKVKAQHWSPRHPNIPHHFSSSYGVYLIKIRSPVFLSVSLAASMRTPSFAHLSPPHHPSGTGGISTYSPAVRGGCTCPLEQRWCMGGCPRRRGWGAASVFRPWL